MKKKIAALLLAVVLVLSFSATAFADPTYSPDGVTCTGEGCHGNASQQESAAPSPTPAPTVEEEPAAEDADHTAAAEKIAEIIVEELFPNGMEETAFQQLLDHVKSFLSLVELLVK